MASIDAPLPDRGSRRIPFRVSWVETQHHRWACEGWGAAQPATLRPTQGVERFRSSMQQSGIEGRPQTTALKVRVRSACGAPSKSGLTRSTTAQFLDSAVLHRGYGANAATPVTRSLATHQLFGKTPNRIGLSTSFSQKSTCDSNGIEAHIE